LLQTQKSHSSNEWLLQLSFSPQKTFGWECHPFQTSGNSGWTVMQKVLSGGFQNSIFCELAYSKQVRVLGSKPVLVLALGSKQVLEPALGSKQVLELALGNKRVLELVLGSKQVLELGSMF
jgi:hypothetical protein